MVACIEYEILTFHHDDENDDTGVGEQWALIVNDGTGSSKRLRASMKIPGSSEHPPSNDSLRCLTGSSPAHPLRLI